MMWSRPAPRFGGSDRETAMGVAIYIERGATQPREIVEARQVLIAELEQRRRFAWESSHELVKSV
jgi:hypothetical protein